MARGRKDTKIQQQKHTISQVKQNCANLKAEKQQLEGSQFDPRKLAKSKKTAQDRGVQHGLALAAAMVGEANAERAVAQRALRGREEDFASRARGEVAGEISAVKADADESKLREGWATKQAAECRAAKNVAEAKMRLANGQAAKDKEDARKAREEKDQAAKDQTKKAAWIMREKESVSMREKDQAANQRTLNQQRLKFNAQKKEEEAGGLFLTGAAGKNSPNSKQREITALERKLSRSEQLVRRRCPPHPACTVRDDRHTANALRLCR